MGLSHVITATVANLIALGYADAVEILPDTLVPANVGQLAVYTGPECMQQHDAPPRVVFVPGDVGKDKFGPTENLSGTTRQTLTRLASAEVHVWGKDYATAEQLVNDTIVALQLAAKGSLLVTSGGFVSTSENSQCGREYVFTMQLAIPVVKPTLKTAPGDVRVLHTGKMNDTIGCS